MPQFCEWIRGAGLAIITLTGTIKTVIYRLEGPCFKNYLAILLYAFPRGFPPIIKLSRLAEFHEAWYF